MKIKKDLILREIAGSYIVVPIGNAALELNGMITLNSTGVFLWNELENDTTTEKLVEKLCSEYEIDKTTATADVEQFITKLRNASLIEE